MQEISLYFLKESHQLVISDAPARRFRWSTTPEYVQLRRKVRATPSFLSRSWQRTSIAFRQTQQRNPQVRPRPTSTPPPFPHKPNTIRAVLSNGKVQAHPIAISSASPYVLHMDYEDCRGYTRGRVFKNKTSRLAYERGRLDVDIKEGYDKMWRTHIS